MSKKYNLNYCYNNFIYPYIYCNVDLIDLSILIFLIVASCDFSFKFSLNFWFLTYCRYFMFLWIKISILKAQNLGSLVNFITVNVKHLKI